MLATSFKLISKSPLRGGGGSGKLGEYRKQGKKRWR